MPPRMTRQDRTAQKRAPVDAHEEWLLDQAIMETFPASDATSPYRSESTTGAPGTVQRRPAPVMRARRSESATFWWIMAGCAMFYAGYVATRRRR